MHYLNSIISVECGVDRAVVGRKSKASQVLVKINMCVYVRSDFGLGGFFYGGCR